MASINIDPPLSTPAHEWAADTTNALQRQNTSSVDAGPISGTGTSSPGSEFPGAFPGGLQTHSQSKSEQAEERTPRAAVTHLADAAPPKSTSGFQETAKGYIPYVDVQRALNTAKAYLPESVVGAVGSVLPGMTNSQPEKNIDPISGAKPASVGSSGSGPESIDNASTTVIPPSTRTGSLTSSMTGDRTPPGDGHNRDLGNALDTTSQAKPNVPTSSLSDIPITSTSPASTAPVPGASSKSTTSPVNAANTAVAMHALPTPPTSDVSSSSNAHADKKEHGGTGRTSATKSGLKDDDSYPQPNDGSRIAKPSQSGFENDGPTPPLKDETSRSVDKSEPSQPKVNVAPGQKHVKSGTAVGARLPGTAPVGGEGAPPSFSPKSEISNPRVQEDDEKDPSREQKFGGSNLNASISSSDDSFEANGNGNGKKEGRVKKAVHKVKDKLSHRSH